jgi:hypothetical protein
MNPYEAVLADLRAKRDAMSELILALEHVGRLGVSSASLTEAIGGKADTDVRPSVRPSVRTRTVPRVKAIPTRRATVTPESDAEHRVLDAVTKKGGMPLGELALAARVNKNTLKATLKGLIQAGRIEARGVRAGTRYWPKEGL